MIKGALTIKVPELDMPSLDDVEVENVVSLESRRRSMAPTWFAVAATVYWLVRSSPCRLAVTATAPVTTRWPMKYWRTSITSPVRSGAIQRQG